MASSSTFSPRIPPAMTLRAALDLLEIYSTAQHGFFEWYAAKIPQYTSRKISDRFDILNAFTGLFNRITRNTGVVFHWGIPNKDTVSALLWSSYPKSHLDRRAGFPSWAWCGWIGDITYPVERWGRHPLYRGHSHVVSRDARVDLPSDSTKDGQVLHITSSKATFRPHAIVVSQLQNVDEGQHLLHLDGHRVSPVGYRELGLEFDELESGNHSEREVEVLLLRKWYLEKGEREPPLPFQELELVTCLLITPHGRTWRRIGMVTMLLKDWEMANPRNVIIDLE